MNEDPRCCGSGTCIIDADGRCWCGQQWDGATMCRAPSSEGGAADPASDPAADGSVAVLPAASSTGIPPWPAA